MFITLSLLILGTKGIFSIMTTTDVNHLVNDTPEAMVALMMVFIVCRVTAVQVRIFAPKFDLFKGMLMEKMVLIRFSFQRL